MCTVCVCWPVCGAELGPPEWCRCSLMMKWHWVAAHASRYLPDCRSPASCCCVQAEPELGGSARWAVRYLVSRCSPPEPSAGWTRPHLVENWRKKSGSGEIRPQKTTYMLSLCASLVLQTAQQYKPVQVINVQYQIQENRLSFDLGKLSSISVTHPQTLCVHKRYKTMLNFIKYKCN